MQVRRFDLENDYNILLSWWAGWRTKYIPRDMLPPVGFISDYAAAFVLETVGVAAFIETLVNNPSAKKDRRSEGTDEVIGAAVKYCKEKGFKKLYALTRKETVARRAVKHSFTWNNMFLLLERDL